MSMQRSKAAWLRLGDDNTKYFFLFLKRRKLQHSITQLKNEFHQIQNDQTQISRIIVVYYQTLLGTTVGQRPNLVV